MQVAGHHQAWVVEVVDQGTGQSAEIATTGPMVALGVIPASVVPGKIVILVISLVIITQMLVI